MGKTINFKLDQVDSADTALRLFQLRAQTGYSYLHLGRMLGLTEYQVAKILEDNLSQMHDDIVGEKEWYRLLEVQRLENLQQAFWDEATGNTDEGLPRLRAAEFVLKVMEKRWRLLGLEAPTRIETAPDWRSEAERLGLDPDQIYTKFVEQLTEAARARHTIVEGNAQRSNG